MNMVRLLSITRACYSGNEELLRFQKKYFYNGLVRPFSISIDQAYILSNASKSFCCPEGDGKFKLVGLEILQHSLQFV